MNKENIGGIIADSFIVILLVLGAIILAKSTRDDVWHGDAVKAGVGQYNHNSGKFEFIKKEECL